MCIGRKRSKVAADICCICLEPLNDVYILECGHRLHVKCGLKWAVHNQNCPLCRKPISNENLIGAVVGYLS